MQNIALKITNLVFTEAFFKPKKGGGTPKEIMKNSNISANRIHHQILNSKQYSQFKE